MKEKKIEHKDNFLILTFTFFLKSNSVTIQSNRIKHIKLNGKKKTTNFF